MENLNLFKEIVIWREVDENTFYRYRGFQNLATGKYSFFYCDVIHNHNFDDVEIQKHHEFAFRQNLFASGLENIHDSEMFNSIEEAIADLESE